MPPWAKMKNKTPNNQSLNPTNFKIVKLSCSFQRSSKAVELMKKNDWTIEMGKIQT